MSTVSSSIRLMVTVVSSAWVLAGCYNPIEPEETLVVALPAPLVDLPPSQDGALQTAVLAGGCFWGVEAVFEHVLGVVDVVSGYSGGSAEDASYDLVSTGQTGHAESVKVTFDPSQITYGEILRIFFSVAHDPTQLDHQGPDWGKQYRSDVFYGDVAQGDVVRAYLQQLTDAGVYPRDIVTRVDPLNAFYLAEEEHQDFVAHYPEEPYVVRYDLPKIENLRRLYPEVFRPS